MVSYTPEQNMESAIALARAILASDANDLHKREFLSYCVWKASEAAGKYNLRYWSEGVVALVKQHGSIDAVIKQRPNPLRHEHVNTRKSLVDAMMRDPSCVEAVLREQAIACLVTKAEHDRLPNNYSGFGRYRAANIRVVDVEARDWLDFETISKLPSVQRSVSSTSQASDSALPMKFATKDDIVAADFTGFIPVRNLHRTGDRKVIPTERGVYLILRLSHHAPEFRYYERLCGTTGYSVIYLTKRWQRSCDSCVMYIGQTKVGLRKRLAQYLRRSPGHQGGRAIWQLRDSDDLLVCWKVMTDGSPEQYERQLLDQFYDQYGVLPFANLI